MITNKNCRFPKGGGNYLRLLVAALISFGAVIAQAAVGRIPAEYTEIEYIEGNGKDARIVTDYVPQPNIDKIEAVVEWTTVDKTTTIWCARGATTATSAWTLFMLNNSGYKFRIDYDNHNGDGYISSLTVAANVKYTIVARDNRVDIVGGAQPASFEYSQSPAFTCGGPVTLFASYFDGTEKNVNNWGKHRLYSFKVWRSGALIHYFVPCKDFLGNATMVDICDNSTTLTKDGTFSAGSEGHYYDDSLFLSDDALEVSGFPGLYGSPTPAYGIHTGLSAGDTVAVSCASYTNTTLMIEYICTGWKLFNGAGTEVSNGTETAFTYTHPTPAAARRLVWQWAPRALSTISDATLPVDGAAFHVDASMPSTIDTIESDGKQLVTAWRDASGGSMRAVCGTASRPRLVTDDKLPYIDFGPQTSGNASSANDNAGALVWSSELTTVREVFLVFSDYPGSRHSFFLGASNTYHFHRNQKKLFNNQYASTYVKNGLKEVDGVECTIDYELPEGFHIIHLRTTGNVTAGRFAWDRNVNYGGQRLQEVVVYTKTLTDAEAEEVYDYLHGKWITVPGMLEIDAIPAKLGSPTPAYGAVVGLASGEALAVSCGATPTINDGKAYACTGWKLYDVNGDVVSIGNETSFTYTHPTPAEYRKLEWQWAELWTPLPIPDQVNETFDPCRPELTVSNMVDGTTWTIGGNLSSPYFDVEYANNHGANTATATVTGKGDYAGLSLVQTFKITATKLEDENISTTDVTARRREAAGKCVYIFTNAAAKQVTMVKRDLLLTDYLVVGGGGGGGNTSGGGGGAGGVTNVTGLIGKSLAGNDIFTVSVGAGGAGASGYNGNGANGKATSLRLGDISVSMAGGGGGGSWFAPAGVAGASGGGGTKGGAGGAGTEGIGHDGAAAGLLSRSGGGGGAGHAGYQYTDGSTNRAGNGGEGILSSITGEALYYGGGGGGGGSSGGNDNYYPGFGGSGGGGDGERSIPGHPGADGFGGGGGGGGWANNQQQRGGNGGSGTVILAFKPFDFNIDTIPPQTLVAGEARPEPVVRLYGSSTVLTKDVHYEVTYTNNVALGTALMTVTGIGTYAGKVGYATFLVVERYYAKPAVDVEGDGLSWATAMSVTNFFATHGVVDSPCEVWIAAGTVSAPSCTCTLTNSATLAIRGGFAGTETSLDERAEGALTVFDGENTSSILLTIDNATDDDIFLDRIKFCRARSNGFVKTGKGGLKAYDCVFETNGRNVSEVYGRGMNAQSDGYGSLVVSNCVFAGNRSVNSDKQWGGFGLYVKNFNDALVDDSLFLTNGYDLSKTPSGTYVGYLNARGSALLVDSTPITIRNSRFAGNCCPVRKKDDTYWCGGTIALNGACGGSVIDHCALIGNTEIVSAGDEGSNSGGAIAVRMNSTSAKVAVRNCTIAYNLTQSPYSSGGITVYKGSADISNTILWKNLRYHTTSHGYGRDLHVASGSARISHSLVTSLDSSDECVVGATVDEESVFALDPKLVTSTAVFESLLTQNATGPYFKPTTANPTVYEDLAGMDAHLLSPAGYFVNGGAPGPATTDYSPAIDLGDIAADYSNEPAPNGGRINLGAYGNTAEASSSATGQPEANVEVTFPDGMTRPKVTITMGLESGAAYSATVQLYCSTGGVLLSSQIWRNVGNGEVLEFVLPYYLTNGDDFSVMVMINAPNSSPVEYQTSETVDGKYPDFYGKGGGPNVIHVRTGANCKMDGSSWTDAYPDLATALASAPDASKTEIWLSVTNDYMNASVTLVGSITVRGGFTGVENSAAERPEGLFSTLDGVRCNYKTMDFSVPSGALLTVERIRFSHSAGPGLRKTGSGDLTVRDCYFTDRKQSDWSLLGGGIYASGGTVSVANCQFVHLIDYSVNALSYNSFGGDGIYLSSCTQAYIDDCLFATNGIQFYRNKGAQARHPGSAVYVNATPTIFRNCRFASNGSAVMEQTGCGGAVFFNGACGGSKMINCTLVGNADFEGSQSSVEAHGGGAVYCLMSSAAATLDIENCTIAYNLTQGKWAGAGINVGKGTVNLKNSVIYGNVRGRTNIAEIAGADIEVKVDGRLNMSYTLVTGLTSNYIHSVNAENLTIGPGVIADLDPLLATTTNDFWSLLASHKNSPGSLYLPQSARGDCAELDVHPRTRTGYIKDGVLIRDPEWVESPTIDKGDPTSDYMGEPMVPGVGYHGRRVNLGAYGNTPEAALTRIRGFHIIVR